MFWINQKKRSWEQVLSIVYGDIKNISEVKALSILWASWIIAVHLSMQIPDKILSACSDIPLDLVYVSLAG